MLLCLVKGPRCVCGLNFCGCGNGALVRAGWGCGQDREGPLRVERKLSSAWVPAPPVMERVSTMGDAISFLRLKGWHAPAGRRTCEPRPLVQDGQIGPARRWVPEKLGPAGRSFRRTARCGVSRLGGQAGTQVSDATPPPGHRRGSRARSTIHTLPADSVWAANGLVVPPSLRSAGSGRPGSCRSTWRRPALGPEVN